MHPACLMPGTARTTEQAAKAALTKDTGPHTIHRRTPAQAGPAAPAAAAGPARDWQARPPLQQLQLPSAALGPLQEHGGPWQELHLLREAAAEGLRGDQPPWPPCPHPFVSAHVPSGHRPHPRCPQPGMHPAPGPVMGQPGMLSAPLLQPCPRGLSRAALGQTPPFVPTTRGRMDVLQLAKLQAVCNGHYAGLWAGGCGGEGSMRAQRYHAIRMSSTEGPCAWSSTTATLRPFKSEASNQNRADCSDMHLQYDWQIQ